MNSTSEAPVRDVPAPSSETTHVGLRSHRRRIPVDKVEYHLLRVGTTYNPLLRGAYELWRDNFEATLRELEAINQLESDEFSRQHEVGLLTIGRCCVAMTGLRWLDFSHPMAREDSYFRRWPSNALDQIGECRVGVQSNLVVDAPWRRAVIDPSDGGPPLSLPLAACAMGTRRFLDSTAEKFVGTTRNDRSVNRVGPLIGLTKVGQIQVHGVESDLFCGHRRDAPDLGPVVETLWRSRWH